jgi:hypothetical protein
MPENLVHTVLTKSEKQQSQENTHQKRKAAESRKYSPKGKSENLLHTVLTKSEKQQSQENTTQKRRAAEPRKYSPKGRSRRVQDVQETSIITVSDSSP